MAADPSHPFKGRRGLPDHLAVARLAPDLRRMAGRTRPDAGPGWREEARMYGDLAKAVEDADERLRSFAAVETFVERRIAAPGARNASVRAGRERAAQGISALTRRPRKPSRPPRG